MKTLKLPPTVFKKLPKDALTNEHITALSNRTAVIVYFLYFVWAVLTTTGSIPTISNATNELTQFIFSLFVGLACIPAFIGALFFPLTGRIELYGSIVFVTLITIYLFFIGQAAVMEGSIDRIPSIVLILTTIIKPAGRSIFIFRQLMRKGTK